MNNLSKNNNFSDEMELIKAQSQKINNLYYDLENKDKIINEYLIQLKNYSNIKEENENLKKNIKTFEEKINLLNSKNNKELLNKENYINNLQNNYSNLEGQYHQTLKSTLNSCQNSKPLSSNNSKSYLFDNREQKYSFYGNFNDRKSNCNNCSNNNLN